MSDAPPPPPSTSPPSPRLLTSALAGKSEAHPPSPPHLPTPDTEPELRVKKTDKAKFFKGAKKTLENAKTNSEAKTEVVEDKTAEGEDKTVAVPQMNGKHSDKEEVKEENDEEKVPSSAKKRKKGEKKAKSKAVVDTESDASGSETEVAKNGEDPPKTGKSALENIPTDFRFDPKNLANKPKGLVDALSSFFTPGLKRTSRTAMNSLLKPETVPKESPLASAKVEEGKKVRLSVEEKEVSKKDGAADEAKADERKRHASAGQQQVKSLYDGLSHLYADCDSRLRSAPNSEKAEKEAKEKEEEEEEEKEEEGKEDARATSPNRLSDGESKEKDDAKKEDKDGKAEDGDKTKGSSKKTVGCVHGLDPTLHEQTST